MLSLLTGNEVPCPAGANSPTGFTPGCTRKQVLFSITSLRAGTPQCDEEKQQIRANSRNMF